jgi:hypothetical protein
VRHISFFKRSSLIGAVLLGGTVVAHAYHYEWRVLQPGASQRKAAQRLPVFNAGLNACYAQTGASRQDQPAFKQCMLNRKWQWQSGRIVPGRSQSKRRPDCFDLTFDCGFKNF